MLLSRRLAGFTRGESDKLRKAMGKKQIDVMNELKAKFAKGCLENPEFRIGEWADVAKAESLVEKIWSDWEAFASYAFNKSHAVCYAWIAYQTGFLKAHYPAEFMCAQISSEIGNFDKLPGFVAEAQAMDLELRLPDVNESGARFVPTPDAKGIRYGLGGIKGVGELAAEAIVAEREANGPYKGFMDFCVRLAGCGVANRRVLENLVRAGAFSTLQPNRAMLFDNIEFAMKKAQGKAKEDASAQSNFFDMMSGGSDGFDDSELVRRPPHPPAEDLAAERELLGVYVSGHPLQSCRRLIAQASRATYRAPGSQSEDAPEEREPFPLSRLAVAASGDDAEAEGDGGAVEPEADASGDDAQGPSDTRDGGAPEVPESVEPKSAAEAMLRKARDDDWLLKGLARAVVRAGGAISPADREAFDKAVSQERARFKRRFAKGELDPLLLKRADVRVVAMLEACSVKTPKPRPDGTPGKKWAILTLDDGTSKADVFCYAKAWEKCAAALEGATGGLVLVEGEISCRATYPKEDGMRRNPRPGDIVFSATDARPAEDALPSVSKGLRIALDFADSALEAKVAAVREAIMRNPGALPVFLDLAMPDGGSVAVDAGPGFRASCGISFLSELCKAVPQGDLDFGVG